MLQELISYQQCRDLSEWEETAVTWHTLWEFYISPSLHSVHFQQMCCAEFRQFSFIVLWKISCVGVYEMKTKFFITSRVKKSNLFGWFHSHYLNEPTLTWCKFNITSVTLAQQTFLRTDASGKKSFFLRQNHFTKLNFLLCKVNKQNSFQCWYMHGNKYES